MPIVAPVSCWDHIAHKGFAAGLSWTSTIELNTAQYFGKLNLTLNQVRLKFETTAIDSNFMHLRASAMKSRTSSGNAAAPIGIQGCAERQKAASGNAEPTFQSS
jgi:hypothetical protein